MARIGTKLCQNAFRAISDVSFFDLKKFFSAKNLNQKFCFSQFSRGFGGAGSKRTSKSTSASKFAPGTPVLTSVRPEIVKKGSCTASASPIATSGDWFGPGPIGGGGHVFNRLGGGLRGGWAISLIIKW